MKTEQTSKKTTKAKTAKKAAKKLTLAEKQAIKLKIQKERQAKKIAAGDAVPKNKDRFYCTSAELTAELVKWRDSNIEEENKLKEQYGEKEYKKHIDYTKRTISEELGKMLIMIADKMLNRSEFRNYPKELKEDAKSYFLLKSIKGLKNYNFEFNNPFAYFTTGAWNSYLSVISKYYKHQNTRKDLMIQQLSDLESCNGIDPHSSLVNYIRQYIELDEYGPVNRN